MSQTKTIVLSMAAARDLAGLLPELPILGNELNAFVKNIKAQLDLALTEPSEKTQLLIEIYPVKEEAGS